MSEPAIHEDFVEAVRLHQSGQLPQAERLYRQILAHQPNHARAMQFLGVLAYQCGQKDQGVELIRRSIALQPGDSDAYFNLGNILKERGEIDQAIDAYRRAAACSPNRFDVHNNLGVVLQMKGQFDEAIAAYRQSLSINPQHARAHNNLGYALKEIGQIDESVNAHRVAIVLDPNLAEAHHNLSTALQVKQEFDEAIAASRRAIALMPNFAEAHGNLGNALLATGRVDQAIACGRRAIEIKPQFVVAHTNLVYVSHYHPDMDAKAILAEAKRWNECHAEPFRARVKPHGNDRSRDRRLRIGYIGGHFRDHCQSLFTLPLLANHDASNFEVFGYSTSARGDAVTQQIQSQCAAWRVIERLSDEQAAQLIRDDRIDILIDITMMMGGARALVLARKPAPIQIAWLAYPGTTGNWAIDYRITDPYLDPPGCDESVYSERTIRLPDTFWCYRPINPDLDPGPLPAIEKGRITFGSLNNFCKINTRTLELWAPVLAGVKDSHLLLLSPPGQHRQFVLDFFAAKNIDADRIRFVEFQPRKQYLETYRQIDVGLDTLPYNGHTTSLDAFRMGVPVVTRIGNTIAGRAGFSQLSNLGLTELAGNTDEEFASIAISLANDLPRLSKLRATLRQRMDSSPLTDAPRFAENMEAIYRRVWKTWCESGT